MESLNAFTVGHRMEFYKKLLFLLLLSSGVVSAEVYRWHDADGKLHYGDRPPADAEQMNIRSAPNSTAQKPTNSDRKEARQRLLDLYREERAEKKKLKQERIAKRKERKQKCLQARVDLDNYQYASGIYRPTERGEREFLSKEERANYIQDLRDKVNKWCR